MRVLLVEDEALTARSLEEALTRAGHEVVGIAQSAEEALRLAASERPNIAFVDSALRHTDDRIELTEQLTADLGVEVVICTEEPEIARRSQSGAIGLIAKPFDMNDIVASVTVIEAIQRGVASPPPLPRSFELLVSPQ